MKANDLRISQVQDNIQSRLADIWREVLDEETIRTDDNFFDLGGDSSLAVRMFAKIDETFNIKLPLAVFYEAQTIDELACVLRDGASPTGWSPLVAIQPEGSRPPLFCFHGAGGNVLIYRDLSRCLGSDQPFYGLQAQGMNSSLPPLTTIEEMAAMYVKEIRKIQPYGPYFLGGYCGGGTIAYEAAQQLQANGECVALLALFDTMNWSKIPITVWSKATYACQRLVFHAASFLSLDPKGRLEFVRNKREILRSRLPVWRGMLMSRFNMRADETTSAALLLGQIWQNNDRACWQYVPKPYPGVITDFRPSAQYGIFSKPELKWDLLAQGGQDVVTLPVYPASMLLPPCVEHLAVALRKSMDHAMCKPISNLQTDCAAV